MILETNANPESILNELRTHIFDELCPDLFLGSREQGICAMDTIEDTELAIRDFNSSKHAKAGFGRLYLIVYGLLQALIIQQDATVHLCRVFSHHFHFSEHPELKRIRDIRNACGGHPTERAFHVEHGPHFNSLCRIELSQQSMSYLTVDSRGEKTFNEVDLPSLIAAQSAVLTRTLWALRIDLLGRIREFKSRFLEDKLAKQFTEDVRAALASLAGTLKEGRGALGLGHLQRIEDYVKTIQLKLEERGLAQIDHWRYLRQKIRPHLVTLGLHFQGNDLIDKDSARNSASELIKLTGEVKNCCKEIDQDYVEATEDDRARATRARKAAAKLRRAQPKAEAIQRTAQAIEAQLAKFLPKNGLGSDGAKETGKKLQA